MPRDDGERPYTEWLTRARSAMTIAKRSNFDEVSLEDLCFQAQQAAEKALKALYRATGNGFRYTHDIKDLILGLRHGIVDVPSCLDETVMLSRYAVETRYPYCSDDVTFEDYQQAVRYAEMVFNGWTKKLQGYRFNSCLKRYAYRISR